jgi:hypothetical protein
MKNNKRHIAPDYPRIPHLPISNKIDIDDIVLDIKEYNISGYYQEKVDGANCGISWDNGPILRNRDHILRKGFPAKTPAKKQFVPAWNWLHDHEEDIKNVEKIWGGKVTIYGEWLLAKHSIEYNNLPDYFLAYDIWSVEEGKFISPRICKTLLLNTTISWIDANKIEVRDEKTILDLLDIESNYRNGNVEGIVIKTVDDTDEWINDSYKVVRNDFTRQQNWNKQEMIKNLKR